MSPRTTLLLLLTTLLPLVTRAGNTPPQERNLSFPTLSLEQGLSQTTVTAICQDYTGSLWIGTYKGLNRLVNNRITSYTANSADTTSIAANHILFIDQDHASGRGNLWIGTMSGLMRYNSFTDRFERTECNGKPITVYDSCHTDEGVCFAGHKTIYFYDYRTRQITTLFVDEENPDSQIESITPIDDHTIVASDFSKGISVIDLRSRVSRRQPELAISIECSATMVDSQGRLWISPYNKGLQCLHYQGAGKFELLHQFDTSNSRLSNNTVLDIIERDGELWIATDGGGISVMNLNDFAISTIRHNPSDANSIPVNSITRLYVDNDNNFWAGTVRSGLLGIKQNDIVRYNSSNTGQQNGLKNETVLSLYCDDSSLWIGTDGGGLNRFDLRSERFECFDPATDPKVQSIARLDDQNLLLSVYNQGLEKHNYCGSRTPFMIVDPQTDRRITQSNMIVNLNRAGNGKIWLTGHTLYCYNPADGEFARPPHFDRPDGSFYLYLFHTDPRTSLMHDGNDIFGVDNTTLQIDTLFTSPHSKRIRAITVDNNGTIWFCTNHTLERINTSSGSLKTIDLPVDSEPDCMICDNKQRIWIGMGEEVLCFLIDADKFAIFDSSDGVLPNEYFTKAVAVSEQGDIFMGGVTGLLRIKGSIRFDREIYNPILSLVWFAIDGKPVEVEQDHGIATVKVPWRFNSMALRIAVRDADVFRHKSFRFAFDGPSSTTLQTTDDLLTITSLNSGRYTVSAQCSKRDGGWTTPCQLLELVVMPPWWKSTLFIVLAVVGLLALTVTLILYIVRRRQRIMEWEMRGREKKMADQKVRFLINISHELRTPLTLIYGPLKRLIDSGRTADDVKEELVKILSRTKSISHLINMVLDVRKMEVGNDTLHVAPFELNDWVRGQAESFADEYDIKRIAIDYSLDSSIGVVNFDGAKCETVISNLLMNAMKYSPSQTTVTVATSRTDDQMIRISVIDQGIGLDNVNIDHLFERFYQTSNINKGNGIGLSYSKMLVTMHGGRIGAFNNEGAGSTFWFELPVNLKCADVECNTDDYMNDLIDDFENRTAQSRPEVDLSHYTVLLVDDDQELIDFLKTDFAGRFHKIYTANDGAAALEIIKEHLPDVVVSDVMMPVMDGMELCRMVKTNFEISHIPVVLLTARSDQRSTATGYKMGADVYIPKPFDNDFLLTIIANLLSHREAVKRNCNGDRLGLQPEQITFSNADEQFLTRLNAIIDEHLVDSALDADAIGSMMHLSRTTLYRKMQSITGMGINIYVNRQKIAKAQAAMEQSDLSIAEIASSVGFADQRYFATVFKQITGLSPTRYREEKRRGGAI